MYSGYSQTRYFQRWHKYLVYKYEYNYSVASTSTIHRLIALMVLIPLILMVALVMQMELNKIHESWLS